MKTESFKILEVGRSYLSRKGMVVEIKLKGNSIIWPFLGSNSCIYKKTGQWSGSTRKTDKDLISLILDEVIE